MKITQALRNEGKHVLHVASCYASNTELEAEKFQGEKRKKA